MGACFLNSIPSAVRFHSKPLTDLEFSYPVAGAGFMWRCCLGLGGLLWGSKMGEQSLGLALGLPL